MKLINNQHHQDEHNHPHHPQSNTMIERIRRKIREYWNSMYRSHKCKKMPRGSYYQMKSMSLPRGDNWRRHRKSLNKQHKD